jgi:hypothetical protein
MFISILLIFGEIYYTDEFIIKQNNYNENSQFGSNIAQCEFSALKLGSDFADVFNAPIGDQDWDERHKNNLI